MERTWRYRADISVAATWLSPMTFGFTPEKKKHCSLVLNLWVGTPRGGHHMVLGRSPDDGEKELENTKM